ncbi:hypothetical protein CQA49_04150 [Helicobacter sp. MIT 00-7814]|uniref:hypothetical protein n=1 Tax=unclassified Helicobacter TaxID=2593540 RepID=UPI000E1EA231|nr:MULTISPECIES: hypothetical protein [unclassified Helicobacter]RDU55027.1 hypothetical protein CQA49_04150 [Helicobacter sp. MIT 00-7814]RDU55942.1 hypothetical protein CQA37_03345 [Helicobacter sp. MIT 99-10781]
MKFPNIFTPVLSISPADSHALNSALSHVKIKFANTNIFLTNKELELIQPLTPTDSKDSNQHIEILQSHQSKNSEYVCEAEAKRDSLARDDIINNTSLNPKALLIFIGGFMDSMHLVVFRQFAFFAQGDFVRLPNFCAKMYATFNSKALFSSLLPALVVQGYEPYIFAHSWGSANICKVLHKLDSAPNPLPKDSIKLLVTLDPVGYWKLHQKPQSIQHWCNIYIGDKFSHLKYSNICTYFGHAWNHCSGADSEIMLDNLHSKTKSAKIIHHASISTMLQAFNTANIPY